MSAKAAAKPAAKGPEPPRRAPTQERARKKVDAILAACGRVLAAEGYEGATTSAIAKAAGVPVGTLYEYFPNREAIFSAFLENTVEQVIEAVARVSPAQMGKSPSEAVGNLIAVAVHAVSRYRGEMRALLSRIPGALELPALQQLQGGIAEIARALSWLDPETAESKDFERKLYILTNTIFGFFIRLATGPEPPMKPGEITRELTSLVLRYLEVEE
ncbi:MAG: TetR/AcrR family transcriptional regulator [Chrysiogenetes bacterium]|nr:TetR/AcrR family transcriptional regulator [Chrysiogenetes bacterium]